MNIKNCIYCYSHLENKIINKLYLTLKYLIFFDYIKKLIYIKYLNYCYSRGDV